MRPRGVAAITALVFVACGLLAMRHEASTAHVRDRAGGYVHAAALSGHHVGDAGSDIHAQRDPDADTSDCALLTAFHQAASAHVSAPALGSAVVAELPATLLLRAATVAVQDVYRLAPKTSPPAAV